MKTTLSLVILGIVGLVQPVVAAETAGRDRSLDVIGRASMLEGRIAGLLAGASLPLAAPFSSLEAVADTESCSLDDARDGQQFRFSCSFSVTVGRQLPGCIDTPCKIGTLTEHLWFTATSAGLAYASADHGELKLPVEDLSPPPERLIDALHVAIVGELSRAAAALHAVFADGAPEASDIDASELLTTEQRNLFRAVSSPLLVSQKLPADAVVDCGSTSHAGVLCLPDQKEFDQKGMLVCNEHASALWFAWGRKATSPGHPQDWRTKGWEKLDPGRCEKVERELSDDEDRDDYYWFASSYKWGNPANGGEQRIGEMTWGGEGTRLCMQVDATSFNLVQPQPPCPADDGAEWLERDFARAHRKGMKFLVIYLMPRELDAR